MEASDLLLDAGLFTVKLMIVLIGAALLVGIIARGARGGGTPLKIERLDRRWRRHARDLLEASGRRSELKALAREAKVTARRREPRARVFVCAFDGDLRASGTARLAEELTAILQVAGPNDELVLRLKSPGGLVHAYGHASAELERVRAHGLRLTVAVDEVAASGGYLMAAVADTIIAAPFAVIGSIGVVAQIPNLHRFLKNRDVDVELHTAGRYKRTLTLLGENTDEGRAKFKADLERTHSLFKAAVSRYRPTLDLEVVATGEHWYGAEALALGLVDRIETSEAYLVSRSADADILSVSMTPRRSLTDRLGARLGARLGVKLRREVERTLSEPPILKV